MVIYGTCQAPCEWSTRGAIDHVMDRGDRQDLLKTLAEARRKTDWPAHAY